MNLFSLFAVLLIVTQAPVPTSGQAPNNTAQNTSKKEANGNDDKKPLLPSRAVVKPNAATPAPKPDASEQHGESQQNAVSIVETPSVPVVWTRHEKIAWGVNLALAGFAAFGVCIAIKTLKTVKRQTEAAMIAAKASLRQANHIVASERAWMLIEGDPNPGFDSWIFNFSSKNYGKSPAEILFTDLSFGVLNIGDDLPEEPSYTKAKDAFSNREWVPPQGDTEVGSFHSYGVFTGELKDEFDKIKEGRKILWLYGVVRYRDTVSATIHETRFCYWRKVGTGLGLIMGGPPGYNQCT